MPKQRLGRSVILNRLVQYKGYESYLEIGCAANATFSRIQTKTKIGVDPKRGGTHHQTSDEFFQDNRAHFDLVFIDGLHLADQVLRDVENSLMWLLPGGTIALHDCLPKRRIHQLRDRRTVAWNGDVWKAIVDLRQRADIDVAVGQDAGMGYVLPRSNTEILDPPPEVTWKYYKDHRNSLMRVMDWSKTEEFLGIGDDR